MNSVGVNFLEHARLGILACILEPQLLIYVGLRDLGIRTARRWGGAAWETKEELLFFSASPGAAER